MNIRDPERDRARVRDEVARRGLLSVMNDTKWQELREAVACLPFRPAFQVKDILGDTPSPAEFNENPWHEGDWWEGIYPFYSIEWIRVAPRLLRSRGQLLDPEIEDICDRFVALLVQIGVPFQIENQDVFIYGYTASPGELRRTRDVG